MFDYQQKIDHYARMLVPGICVLLLLVLSLAPLGMMGLALFPVDICLISIYYWVIFRPTALPFWFVFLLGIIRDALTGMPLGISSLLFLLFRIVVLSQQRYLVKETFWATWLGFGIVTIPVLGLHWLLASAYVRAAQPLMPVMMQWVVTFGLYPMLHILFNMLYGFLPPPIGRSGQHHKSLL
jgi:rod shape-determining protein MreD